MIELHTLGVGEICTDKTRVTPSQRVVFAAGLYLIVERAAPVSRNRLASLLWTDVPRHDQGHRLRQTLYQLKTLGIMVSADRDFLKLPRDSAITDFEKVASGDMELPDDSDSLSVLPGYAPRLSEAFEQWLDALRDKVHSDLTRLLVAKLRKARTTANWQAVERVSRICLSLDPYNEAGVLARAEAFAMRGQKAKAISILDTYVKELGSDNHRLVLPVSILRRRVLQNDDRSPTTAPVSNEPEFVGRNAEMASLTRMLENARKGMGGGCLIEGEPGIGKTRLSGELATFAELQGVQVQRVACKRPDTDQPLSALVSLVPRLRELPGALGCSHSTLTWLKRLTEVDASSSDLVPPSEDSFTLYTHLRSAIFDLLDAVCDENCLLIIVEDIQWLDHASAKLFGALLEWAASKKILFLFNSRETRRPPEGVFGDREISTIQLKPLASDDATTLVGTLLAGVACEGEVVVLDSLIEAGEGNPYFLQELAKHWVESGQTREVPPSIATVLDERLARLSPLANQLLQACAVLGEHSNLDRVEQVFSYTPQELFVAVQELSVTGMLRSNPADERASQNLFVRHDLLSMEVLRILSPAALAFLHRRCATVLEREVLGNTISISLMRACAFHWFHSGNSERAYDLAVKCADHLLEIGLATDAANAFDGALAFTTVPERQLELLRRIIQAHRMAADRPALLAAIRRFRALTDFAAPSSHHDDIEIQEFDALRTTEGDLLSLLSRTVACVYDKSLPAGHRVSVGVVALKLSTSLADLKSIEHIYSEIEPLLADDTVDVRSRLHAQVIYHTMSGDLRRGLSFAKERVAFERAHGNGHHLLNAFSDLVYVLKRAGPLEELLAVSAEAYDTALEHKNYAMAGDTAERLGSILEEEERPESKEWMERARQDGKISGELHGNFSFNADSVRIALRENRLDDAREILEQGLDWEWLKPRRMWLAAALGLRIRLLIAEKADVTILRPHVTELRNLYTTFAGLGRQDYEVAALLRGMAYMGEEAVGKSYLDDYLTKTRRDLTPLSPELRSVAQQFY